MPVDPVEISSQGATVSFDGSPIGNLLQVAVRAGTAVTQTVTSMDSPVQGSGDGSRICRALDCTAVDPGTVTVRLLGMPPWDVDDIGTRGEFSATTPGGTVSGEAILSNFEFEAAVGDLVKGSAEFVFTGA